MQYFFFIFYLDGVYFIEWIKLGIGCHHAGMSFPERSAVENLFRNGYLDVLVATSTLGK